MTEIRRYVGPKEETTFGTKVAPPFYAEANSISIDPPDSPNLIRESSIARTKRTVAPGMYVPGGSIEMVADPATLYYWLYLLMGTIAETDNTTPVTAESDLITTAEGETSGSGTPDNFPIVPGTVTIEPHEGSDLIEDDGFGNMVDVATSAVDMGTVNYLTGLITVTSGLTESTVYDVNYSHGDYEQVVTLQNDIELESFTLKTGKDEFMHTFTGCAMNSLTLSVEKEWVTVSMEFVASKDEKETIMTQAAVVALIPQEYPLAFHHVTVQAVDYGGSLVDISSDVEKLTLTFTNNADAEGGVTLGSRFPRRIFAGGFDCNIEMGIVFNSTAELEDFWGGATGPSTTDIGTLKALSILLNSGHGLGDVVFDLPRCIVQKNALQPSGRDRVIQEISMEALYDDTAAYQCQVTSNVLYSW